MMQPHCRTSKGRGRFDNPLVIAGRPQFGHAGADKLIIFLQSGHGAKAAEVTVIKALLLSFSIVV
jgi:hypothetical protein